MPETDEVDALVEAWGRERADLDLAPVEVFSRISRLGRQLDRARREAFTAQAIEPWEFDVLAALRRAGRPYQLSPGRLLRETMVTSGTMTNRIDRLGDRGLVERSPDPPTVAACSSGSPRPASARSTARSRACSASERDLLAELSAVRASAARRPAQAAHATAGLTVSTPDLAEAALRTPHTPPSRHSVPPTHRRAGDCLRTGRQQNP